MTTIEALKQIETWMRDGTLTGIEITQEGGGLALDAAIDGEYGHLAVMRDTFEEALVSFVEDGKLYFLEESRIDP